MHFKSLIPITQLFLKKGKKWRFFKLELEKKAQASRYIDIEGETRILNGFINL